MTSQGNITQSSELIRAQLAEKLGARGSDLGTALKKARHRLPRRVYRQGMALVEAEPLLHHPTLRMTLDTAALGAAAKGVSAHLDAIDVADRRKGWWLGMLGALAFNLLAASALIIAFLIWRDIL